MISHIPYSELGGADHGWLNAKHHFSFGGYYDPERLCHGELMVINDDRIAPKTGFGTHPHEDMEIITYVRRGAITHEDSKGNKGRTTAGNVQVMSAGSGIEHSEHNLEDEETSIYQIWIQPRSKGIEPSWGAAEFPSEPVTDSLPLLVSGNGDAPLSIHQDARIYAGRLSAGTAISHPVRGKAYALISEGAARIGGSGGAKGDGFAIADEDSVAISATEDCEVLVIEVPGETEAR